ncbi:MAG TPA: endonuclease/exonuclease/phosphatase family protein [Stellaceae bacterium]|nr:endonuclease/exonuclease/phosphatase family protein [Stellaceae bacterium]
MARVPPVILVSTVVVDLPPPDPAVLAEAQAVPATTAEHLRLASGLACLSAIEVRPPPAPRPLGPVVRVAAWNAERCKYATASAALLAATESDIILLSEVDVGMARSGNRHTVADLADALGMGYAYGVEFVELGLGDTRERALHAGEVNTVGFHGNAILSRAPIDALCLIRLDDGGVWFSGMTSDQRRLGWRMAIAARIGTPNSAPGAMVAVTLHLESHSHPADRAMQIERLIAEIDRFAEGLPVVIAGDCNTTALPADDEGDDGWFTDPDGWEPLFRLLRRAGYEWIDANTSDVTQRTRPDGSPPPPFRRIDWCFTRGFIAGEARTIPAVDAGGSAISDHEAISATVAVG